MRGSLQKRSDNSWTIWVDNGRGPDGKRRRQTLTVRGTRKDAERKLAEVLHQLDTGLAILPHKLTVAQYLDRWLRDYVAVSVRPKTFEEYSRKVRTHIIPVVGQIHLIALQPAHLQEFYRESLEHGRLDGSGGLSARTVLTLRRIISEALSHAVRWGLLARNVAQAVDPPRAVHVEMKVLGPQEVQDLLEAARDTMYFPLLHLAIYTGLRRSELLGLRWSDLDFDMASLSVVQTLHVLKGGRVLIHEPKTAKSRRQVSLSPTAVLALRAYRERVEADRELLGTPLTPATLVFSDYEGKPLRPTSVSRAFRRIARTLGIIGVRFHDLRHTHATLMLRANVHPKVVQERLGHSTISTTLDTYSHVVPGMQERAALVFDHVVAEAGGRVPLAVGQQNVNNA